MVVSYHGQFVGCKVVPSPHHEVSEVHASRASDQPCDPIAELHHSSVGHAESPRHATGRRCPLAVDGPKRRGEDRLAFMGRRCCRLDIPSRVWARVNRPSRLKLLPDIEMPRCALALHIRPARAANIRPLRPCEPEPTKVVDRSGCIFGPAPGPIEVFYSHHESGRPGALGGDRKRSGVAGVQKTSGRRREASALESRNRFVRGLRHTSHQAWVVRTYAPRARFVAAWQRMQSIGLRVAAATPLTTANQPIAATASAGWLATA